MSAHRPHLTSPTPELSLATMRTLVAVSQAQSIGLAAKAHGISQQAVSERVRTAEHALGVTLFHRTPNGTVPTRRGEEILALIQEHLTHYDEFTSDIARVINPDHEVIHLAASQTIMEHYLPRWLADLHRSEPGIRFTVTSGNSHDITRAVIAGTTALGFIESPTIEREVQHQLATTTLLHDDLTVAVAPDHPWSANQEIPADTVRSTPLILREPGSGTRSTAEAVLGAFAPPIAELESQAAIVRAALLLREPAILPRIALEGTPLRAIAVTGKEMTRPLRAVWRAGTKPRGGLAALLKIAQGPV